MTFVNVGAYSDNQRIKTKAALKQMVKESPDTVRFDQTSALGNNGMPKLISLRHLKPGITLTVVGPDPYNARNWYASITLSNGRVKVS